MALVLAIFSSLLLSEDNHFGVPAMLDYFRMHFGRDVRLADLEFRTRMKQEDIIQYNDIAGLSVATVLHLNGLVWADFDLVAFEVTDCVHLFP